MLLSVRRQGTWARQHRSKTLEGCSARDKEHEGGHSRLRAFAAGSSELTNRRWDWRRGETISQAGNTQTRQIAGLAENKCGDGEGAALHGCDGTNVPP
eukprot:3538958-Rhodomonas_salina.3